MTLERQSISPSREHQMSVSINSPESRPVHIDELRTALVITGKLYRVQLVQYDDTWFQHAGVFTIFELRPPTDPRLTVNLAGQCFAQHSGTQITKLYPNYAAIAEDAKWLSTILRSLTDWIQPGARIAKKNLLAYMQMLAASANLIDQLLGTTTFYTQVNAEFARLRTIYLLDENQPLPTQTAGEELNLSVTRLCQIHFGPTDVYQTCAVQIKLFREQDERYTSTQTDKHKTDWVLYVPRQSQYRRVYSAVANEEQNCYIFVRGTRYTVTFLVPPPINS